jgi:hypothetical protein
MIRAAIGGVVALLGLLAVWHWLLGNAVPEALAPARATVRTLDLEELRQSMPEPAALARQAVRLVEEHIEDAAPFEEGPPGLEDADPGDAPAPELASSPVAGHTEGIARDDGVEAALIRRMLSVYSRTVSAE